MAPLGQKNTISIVTEKKWPLVKDIFKYLIVLAVVTWLMINGTQQLGYHWQWYRVPQYIFFMADHRITPGPLVQGLLITIRITAVSLILAGVDTRLLQPLGDGVGVVGTGPWSVQRHSGLMRLMPFSSIVYGVLQSFDGVEVRPDEPVTRGR